MSSFLFQDKPSEFHLSSVTSSTPEEPKRDFSNPMYDAMGSMESAAAAAAASNAPLPPLVPDDDSGGPSPFEEPPSAVIAPSSVTHKASPKMRKQKKELGPSAVDTGKDTQCLVEEGDELEDSEC